MATPAGIERKVRHLDGDVQAIYEMLTTIEATQRRQGNRLDEIAAVQSQHSAKLDEHSVKLDRIIDLLRADRPAGDR